jgi:two-component system response regulator PilR (NtrC family)
VNDKAGLLQCAEDGTLFLDEIADLPLPMQVKLLRVIQEKKVRPVGASQEEIVDVRFLSATHRKLSTMVANGEFREDLYYRINVIELNVPALRQRGDDVLLLAEHILRKLNGAASLHEDARNALLTYAFPGNVRELENMLERAVTLSATGLITPTDLHMRDTSEASTAAASAVTGVMLGEQVEDVQRQAIVEALEKTRYNKTAAAKLLGLSFRQLRYRIKKLGID